MSDYHPHGNLSVLTAGASLGEAKAAMILIHGRGASAQDILMLADTFDRQDVAYLAPQAAHSTWYPYGFMNPIETNQPFLDSALRVITKLMTDLSHQGFPADKVLLGGFSQGACLATEFAARNAQRYGGLIGFSGGLIGPEGSPRDYAGSFTGTPVFLGCSDVDFHIPKERVQETTRVLTEMGADVTERLYPGMGHTVNWDEIHFVRDMLASLLDQDSD